MSKRAKPFFIFLNVGGFIRSARSARSYDESAENYQAINNTDGNRAELRALLAKMDEEAGETPEAAAALYLRWRGHDTTAEWDTPTGAEVWEGRNHNTRRHITITTTAADSD